VSSLIPYFIGRLKIIFVHFVAKKMTEQSDFHKSSIFNFQ